MVMARRNSGLLEIAFGAYATFMAVSGLARNNVDFARDERTTPQLGISRFSDSVKYDLMDIVYSVIGCAGVTFAAKGVVDYSQRKIEN